MNTSLVKLMQVSSSKGYQFRLKITEEKLNIINVDVEKLIVSLEIGDPEDVNLTENINKAITKVV